MDGGPLYPFPGSERLLVFAHDYEAGSIQHRHHHDVPQLLQAARGVMRMQTPEGYWVIPPGRGVWIPAFVPHEIRMVGPVSMRTLYVGSPLSSDLVGGCAVVDVPPLLRGLLDQLAGLDVPSDQRARRRAMEDLVLIEVARMERLRLHIPMPNEPRLRRLCDMLLAQPQDRRTLEALGEVVGASARTVRRLFQQEMGMSFADWRQQARLVEALGRLGEGQPIAAVAHELGYAAPSAFTAMFKRAFGASPKNYGSLSTAKYIQGDIYQEAADRPWPAKTSLPA